MKRAAVFLKNPANIITSLRFVFAAAMLIAAPFSIVFWLCYLCGGISDMADGAVARKHNLQSEFGAKLDSAADIAFAAAIAAVTIIYIPIPAWLWVCALLVAVLRLTAYGIGYIKYRAFAALHTYANKAAGALIFCFPALYTLLGMTAAGIITGCAGLLSSLEELLIIITSKELNRDKKSILHK